MEVGSFRSHRKKESLFFFSDTSVGISKEAKLCCRLRCYLRTFLALDLVAVGALLI